MSGMNTSGWKAFEFKVLVEPRDIEKTTKGGLILADETIEKDQFKRQEGILVDVGPMAFSWAEWPEGVEKPKPGARVMFSKFTADALTGKDGKTYWIMNDKSIMAIEDTDG